MNKQIKLIGLWHDFYRSGNEDTVCWLSKTPQPTSSNNNYNNTKSIQIEKKQS